jgi:hypothetical protein
VTPEQHKAMAAEAERLRQWADGSALPPTPAGQSPRRAHPMIYAAIAAFATWSLYTSGHPLSALVTAGCCGAAIGMSLLSWRSY